MGIFGDWSYPPGCTGPPDDDYPDPSSEEEEIAGILDRCETEGRAPTAEERRRIEEIVSSLATLAHAECGVCEARGIEEMIQDQEIADAGGGVEMDAKTEKREYTIRTGEHAGQRGRILGRWTTPAAWVQLPSGEKIVVAAGTLEPADAGGEG